VGSDPEPSGVVGIGGGGVFGGCNHLVRAAAVAAPAEEINAFSKKLEENLSSKKYWSKLKLFVLPRIVYCK
jgi:hypothetical protein